MLVELDAVWKSVRSIGVPRQATQPGISQPIRFGIPGWPLSRRQTTLLIGLCVLALVEFRTSWFQSRLFSAVAKRLTYRVEAGESRFIRFPTMGPYNHRLGYTRLPEFLGNLKAQGYRIDAQARSSELALSLVDRGLFPIYQEKSQAGLRVLDRDGKPVFASRFPQRIYPDFNTIPPVAVSSLLFIENREMLDPGYPYRNPSVEWDRLAAAVIDVSLNAVDRSHKISGGSTLATQIEKLRHSAGGRTDSSLDKLRQMASASLRAYQDGEDTLPARKRIICDYINSMPLAGVAGFGEVSGLGDGLWAWYGANFDDVNASLSGMTLANSFSPQDALAYRQVLSLFLAVNRPSAYLLGSLASLEARTDTYLHLLADSGVIPGGLRDAALKVRLHRRVHAPQLQEDSFIERKGINAIRMRLIGMLGLDSTYDLDRLDLTVKTTLESGPQEGITRTLSRLLQKGYAEQAGITGHRLLSSDPSKVIYSFTMYERVQGMNLLRVQADTYDQPLNINEGSRLELGSTAKLRTLVTYLEIVSNLHHKFSGFSPDQLAGVKPAPGDRLTEWAVEYFLTAQDKSLKAMLGAAMDGKYSASPGEAFFTGGGMHTFSNFEPSDNGQILTVRVALERSVNLVFIRLMRDIVNHFLFVDPGVSRQILEDENNPLRKKYLERFADQEGKLFLGRFFQKYSGHSAGDALRLLVDGIRATPKRLAVIFRSVRPNADLAAFTAFVRSVPASASLSDSDLASMYEKYGVDKFNLQDRGYLAQVHPLELWLLDYLSRKPKASLSEVYEASARERQEVYVWLFKTEHKHAQDRRIRVLLEEDAFQHIHKSWKRQGYPFESMVPSYASAIGSSGDTPTALATLVGIMLNQGVLLPNVRIQNLVFAHGTPLETVLSYPPSKGERIYPPELANVVQQALVGVVENGTARRANGSVVMRDGTVVAVGGKTGTGDNRLEAYGRGGGLIGSKPVNRTATFVFLIGDRFFGTLTAYVPGADAGSYSFTSALPVQTFKYLVPTLMPVLERGVRKGGGDHPQATIVATPGDPRS